MKRSLTWNLIRGAAAALVFLVAVAARSQQMEDGVKAAFIYNFTKYVRWPAGAFDSNASPLVIGVLDTGLDGAVDSAVDGKVVDGRRIVVKHLKWSQDLSQCQVLFVPACSMKGASQLAKLKSRPILTIGESPGFARRFGIINFVVDDGHVRFEINASTAKEAGLAISSKLMSLAKDPG